MARKRKRDVLNAGQSEIADWKANETASQRHKRRLRTAARYQQELRDWCDARQIEIQIKNKGHHWLMKRDGKVFAEWWPSSAKLVIGQKYGAGIHTHDAKQVQRILEDLLDGREPQLTWN